MITTTIAMFVVIGLLLYLGFQDCKKTLKRKFEEMLVGTPSVTQPVSARKPKKKIIPEPTTEELNNFFSALKLSGKNPAVLSIVSGFSND